MAAIRLPQRANRRLDCSRRPGRRSCVAAGAVRSHRRDGRRRWRAALPSSGTWIEERIASGECAAGTRLPPERDLARGARNEPNDRRHRLSRARASRGLVRGHVGRGTFVVRQPGSGSARRLPGAARWRRRRCSHRPDDSRSGARRRTNQALVSFAAGMPALDRLPASGLAAGHRAALSRQNGACCGGTGRPRAGRGCARRWRLASAAGARHVLVISGAQQGLDLVARCLIDPGDTVVIDRPGYLGAMQAFRAAGARLVGWNFTGERTRRARGSVASLPSEAALHQPDVPESDRPHAVHLGTTRAARAAPPLRLPVVEDDTYRELALPARRRRRRCTSSMEHRSSSASTRSRRCSRLASGSAGSPPRRPIVEQLALVKQRADPHTQNLAQLVVARLIEDKVLDRHLATLRTEHATRLRQVSGRDLSWIAANLARWSRPSGGLYLWGRLATGLDARRLLQQSIARGVTFVAGPSFYPDQGGTGELRVCFTSVPPAEAATGIRALGACLRALQPRPGDSVPVV